MFSMSDINKKLYEELSKEIERLWDAIFKLDEQRKKWQLKYEQIMQLSYSLCKTPEEIECLYEKIKSLSSGID